MTKTDPSDREQGSAFLPKFDTNGLLTAVAVDAACVTVVSALSFSSAEMSPGGYLVI